MVERLFVSQNIDSCMHALYMNKKWREKDVVSMNHLYVFVSQGEGGGWREMTSSRFKQKKYRYLWITPKNVVFLLKVILLMCCVKIIASCISSLATCTSPILCDSRKV